ncbi:hypothetical protein NST41_28235 [Paenibacillus sp. FSL L8-0696]|uniref:hypothetical protein n=1 Tax=Paenibacillus sp. FSL L8-0696 TaxID=2954524 RepID=UPI00211709C2|nr:hypothetical protein [Paenibacillus odorifer]
MLRRTPNDGTAKCIWITEEQTKIAGISGIPVISALRHKKVTLEIGWLSLAHNLLKQAAVDQKCRTAILQY